ncbi:MAG: [ribosomal protein S5]-alanine N-acetyltransferase [Myxococcales bacterium]|jgi:RimJ/RimL family protein N-acetyltransferase|nr:[ribosomal protein S5]-alanine N-acetyltransferase [Myxococcales bacterium]
MRSGGRSQLNVRPLGGRDDGARVTGTQLETERLLLRWFTVDDIDAFNELGTNPQIIRYVGNQPFASLDVAKEMLIAAPLNDYATYGYGRFACVLKQTGQVIGFCGPKFLPDTGVVDLGYRFLPKFWGMGLATESARATIDYARDQLGLQRIVGWVHPDNVASARVLTKLDFSFDRRTTIAIPGFEFDLYQKRLDG